MMYDLLGVNAIRGINVRKILVLEKDVVSKLFRNYQSFVELLQQKDK